MSDQYREQWMNAKPETKEIKEEGRPPVVLVAPPEDEVIDLSQKHDDGKIDDAEFGAKSLVLLAHKAQFDEDGKPKRKNGDLVPGEPIFEEEDVQNLKKEPVGSPVQRLRDAASEWIGELYEVELGN